MIRIQEFPEVRGPKQSLKQVATRRATCARKLPSRLRGVHLDVGLADPLLKVMTTLPMLKGTMLVIATLRSPISSVSLVSSMTLW